LAYATRYGFWPCWPLLAWMIAKIIMMAVWDFKLSLQRVWSL
jgi:hypothetical protein